MVDKNHRVIKHKPWLGNSNFTYKFNCVSLSAIQNCQLT